MMYILDSVLSEVRLHNIGAAALSWIVSPPRSYAIPFPTWPDLILTPPSYFHIQLNSTIHVPFSLRVSQHGGLVLVTNKLLWGQL